MDWDNIRDVRIHARAAEARTVELERELAALRTQPAEGPRWQPIETAPKDGTRVLIFDPNVGIRADVWEAEFESLNDDTKEDGWGGYRGAWTDHAVLSFGYEEVEEYQPTMWMPLPPALGGAKER